MAANAPSKPPAKSREDDDDGQSVLTIVRKRGNSVKFTGERRDFTGEERRRGGEVHR